MSENKKQEMGLQESPRKSAPVSKQSAEDIAMLEAAKVGMRKYRKTLRRLAK